MQTAGTLGHRVHGADSTHFTAHGLHRKTCWTRECPAVTAVLVLLALLVPISSRAVSGRTDPNRGVIRTLFIGDALMAQGMPGPLLVQDPLIDITPIPAEIALIGGDPARRFFRLYAPRTKNALWENHDVVIVAATQADYPGLDFLAWIRDGVIEDGMGFLMADDPASFGGAEHGLSPNPSWGPTPVGDILSVECAEDRKDWGSYWFQIKVLRPENPMVRGLNWEGIPLRAHNRVYERQGSEVVIVTTSNPAGSPVLAWMDFGRGRSISFVNDWGGKGMTSFYYWSQASTALANMVYYAAQVPIPEDLRLITRIRERMNYLSSLRALALSTMDFADRFGANVREVEKSLTSASQTSSKILPTFSQGDFEGSLEVLEEAIAEMRSVSEAADKAMRRALIWIYVSEWFVVTGTSMVCAFLLWTLMVKRRMYREVEVTRLASTDE